MTTTCYMCDELATTKEHVPPKCLFPEAKDIQNGVSYRNHLITVPSCEIHNTEKSKDDEYLLFLLAANVVSNKLAEKHFSSKLQRAINRSPHVFGDFTKKNMPIILRYEDGGEINSAAIKIDRGRFDSTITHIANGLYYHKYKSTFSGSVLVFTESVFFLNNDDGVDINNDIQELGIMVDAFMKDVPLEGQNPDVFKFQIAHNKAINQTLIRLFFYGNFKVIAIMQHVI